MRSVADESGGILDPSDWDAFTRLAHAALDDAITQARYVRDTPVWQPLPPEARAAIKSELPEQGIGEEATYGLVRTHITPYRLGNMHPRYWTRMGGAGFPLAAIADLLCANTNSNTAGQESAGVATEEAVVDWLKDIFGMPAEASGVLTSGCSIAHVIGLTTCRNERSVAQISQEGFDSSFEKLIFYCSEETHNCIDKAIATLGIGLKNLRRLRTNDAYQLDLAALQAQIAEDRRAGLRPCCVIGNAGTLATGSIDDLEAIADVCHNEDLWFHVDGAFGAFAALSPRCGSKLRGMERADSLAVDLHKWTQMPYDVGCAIVRDASAHRRAFKYDASYLAVTSRGPSAEKARFFELGLDLSRSFRALKVWMGFKAYGKEGFRNVVEANIGQAQAVAERIRREPMLDLAFEPTLNVVCFSVVTGRGSDADEAANVEIALRIQESGIAMMQTLTLRGRTLLRFGIVNHRTTERDFDEVLDAIVDLARELKDEQAMAP